jgi:FkbM family methyltransferase
MNRNQILLPVYRALRPVVDGCRINSLARPVWAVLWQRRSTGLIRAEQNGRVWQLDPEIALRGREQEMDTIQWLREVVKPGMTVFDIGANVGQMTLEMAELVGPTGRVIAVEPGPGNLALLQRHVEGNGFAQRVTILAAACCATHGGEADLALLEASDDAVGSGFQLDGLGLNAAEAGVRARARRMKVKVVSLDGVCHELGLRPAVIKIDVEGAELEVLRGAAKTLSEGRVSLRFGFHPFAYKDAGAAQRTIEQLLEAARLRWEKTSEAPWGLTEINVSPEENCR